MRHSGISPRQRRISRRSGSTGCGCANRGHHGKRGAERLDRESWDQETDIATNDRNPLIEIAASQADVTVKRRANGWDEEVAQPCDAFGILCGADIGTPAWRPLKTLPVKDQGFDPKTLTAYGQSEPEVTVTGHRQVLNGIRDAHIAWQTAVPVLHILTHGDPDAQAAVPVTREGIKRDVWHISEWIKKADRFLDKRQPHLEGVRRYARLAHRIGYAETLENTLRRWTNEEKAVRRTDRKRQLVKSAIEGIESFDWNPDQAENSASKLHATLSYVLGHPGSDVNEQDVDWQKNMRGPIERARSETRALLRYLQKARLRKSLPEEVSFEKKMMTGEEMLGERARGARLIEDVPANETIEAVSEMTVSGLITPDREEIMMDAQEAMTGSVETQERVRQRLRHINEYVASVESDQIPKLEPRTSAAKTADAKPRRRQSLRS